MKRCSSCGETKPKNCFHRRSNQKDGLDYYCIECKKRRTQVYLAKPGMIEAAKARAKRWRQANPEKARATHDAWIAKNRDRARQSHKFRLLRHRYGLSRDQYETLMRESGGKCQLCGSDQRLCVDHCHNSSVVRGILCLRCNVAAERFDNVADFATLMVKYLEKHNGPR